MKLLTLNFHNFPDERCDYARQELVRTLQTERPDVVALQEVYRRRGEEDPLSPILAMLGGEYHGVWQRVKIGYGIYDEGLALLSNSPIRETFFFPVSRSCDENNWKTRKILGIRTASNPDDLFFSVHYGRWQDIDEPFAHQWAKTAEALALISARSRVWLMGDFNNPADVRGEGYDLILRDGWQDLYTLAVHQEGEATVSGEIDGWEGDRGRKRIDLLLCNRPVSVSSARVVFDGLRYPIISDHYGVLAEAESERERSIY